MTDDGQGCGVGLVITARETERRSRLGWEEGQNSEGNI
jgi:hypothetical protein